MNNSEVPTFQKSILEILKDTGIYVPIVIAFVTRILGLVPDPYAVTTATLAILIATLLLAGIHLPKITRRKDASATTNLLVVGKPRKTIPIWSLVIDPLRRYSLHSYTYSLIRRRFEIMVILALMVFSISNTFLNYPEMQNELLGLQDCFGSNEEKALFVVIAEFAQSDNLPEIEIVESLHDHLISNLDENTYKICRSNSKNPIGLRVDALELADKTDADVVIWGSRKIVYKVHIELPKWDRANREVSYLPAEETSDFNFIELETQHLGYLTEFTLSEVLFEAGNVEEAQQRIEEAIARAERENFGESIPQDLSEGYFLKALMFDPGTELSFGLNPNPDLQKSIQAYSRAVELSKQQYAARLNLGILHEINGQIGEAIDDYTLLILDQNSPFIVTAYINRSALQSTREEAESDLAEAITLSPAEGHLFRGIARQYDWDDLEGAIVDYKNAIAFDPNNFLSYHLLGQAQLEAGQYDDAKQTYRESCPLLDNVLQETITSDLRDLDGLSLDAKSTVDEIIEELRRCP